MIAALVLFAAASTQTPAAATDSPGTTPGTAPVLRLVSIEIDPVDLTAQGGFDWRAADLDVPRMPRPGERELRILADDAELALLSSRGVDWTLIHEDESAWYASRLSAGAELGSTGLGSWLTPPFAAGGMGGYYTLSEIGGVLDQISAAYPSIVSPKSSIGSSFEGRPMWMVKVSDNVATDEAEPEARFDAMHHSREPESMQATLWFLLWLVESYGNDPLATYLVDERELFFVPCVNPDGYAYNEQTNPGGGGLWRKNRKPLGGGVFGVDLNRNYPYQWGYDDLGSSSDPSSEVYRGPSAASEPETQAMLAFLGSRDFETALSTHCFGEVWLHAFGYDQVFPANEADYVQLEALQTEVNGYEAGACYDTLYPANGGTFDYEHAVEGTMSWTPELGNDFDGFWPPTSRIVPLAEENLLAFQRTALAAGAFVHVDAVAPTELGDGDGFFEPGEGVAFAVELQNAGRAAAAVTATLSTTSAFAAVTVPTHLFGSVASFSSDDTGATPPTLQIDAGAPPGASIDWTVEIEHDGFVQTLTGALAVGQPRPFLVDTIETELGWTSGAPGDDASSGQWVRGDPIGTQQGGEPASPSDDATPGAGVLCWTTGNGGGSSGSDDVDNGHVTLTSPRIDLSGVGTALVRYSRWVADLSTEDDVFRVSISNDDGATWVPLEDVFGNHNEWIAVELPVPAGLARTDEMRLRFVAEDDPNNSVCEAAIDELGIAIYDAEPRLNVYGQAAPGLPVALHVSGDASAPYAAYFSAGTGSLTIPGFTGAVLLDPLHAFPLVSGATGADGLAQVILTLPATPSLSGATAHVQAAVLGASPGFTNAATVAIE